MTICKSKLAIGFVTYHPTDEFYRRIKLVVNAGFEAYIFDNSPVETGTKGKVNHLNNVKYITAGKNLGLGVGISMICGTAYSDGHAELLFFDQDTNFTEETLKFITKFTCMRTDLFIRQYALVVFSSRTCGGLEEFNVQDVMLAISSGSLFFLSNLNKMGGHNTSYFVDGVDYEICLNARRHQLKVGLCANTPGFDHVSEQPDKVIHIFNKSLPLRRYSAARIFDALSAYIKIIFASIRFAELTFAFVMIRSFAIYVMGLILSRIALKS